MGNSYGNLNLFDEKIEQVNRIDNQINSFKKHLESSINNENRVKEIRICELDKDIKNGKYMIIKEYKEKEELIKTINNISKQREINTYNNYIEKLQEEYKDFKIQSDIEFKKKVNILELKKINSIKSKANKIDEEIINLQDNLNKQNLIIRKGSIKDINKYSKLKDIKKNQIVEDKNKIKEEVVVDSNSKIKQITDNIREKIVFLLKSKSKLIDQLKKINPETSNNSIQQV